MIDGFMAILPYVALTIDGMLTAMLFTMAVAIHARRRFMLIGAAAMALLALWFAVLAVTAGPTPVIERRTLADAFRWVALGVSALWAVWLAYYARSLVVIKREGKE